MPFTLTDATPDLWHYLKVAQEAGRPIVLYGMGNGADKIITVCEGRGVRIRDCFASDGFVRGHSFHGRRVLSFTEAYETYGADMLVLLSFASSRPDVLRLIHGVAERCELYAPDVPVCGDTLFDSVFYKAHKEDFARARALLCDDESRSVFDGIIEYKLTGDIDILRTTESEAEDAYRHILHAERFVTAADLGAYNGDSIRELKQYAPSLSAVVAMEPDRRNFRKLGEYAEAIKATGDPCHICAVQAGAWSEEGLLQFHGSGNRNATLCGTGNEENPSEKVFAVSDQYFGKTVSVPVASLDSVLRDTVGMHTPIDYIKYDVEGAERQALLGSAQVIAKDAPALLVSAYHRSEDLFDLPLLVHSLHPAYRLYLRRMTGVPAWDVNLYAVRA